KEDIEDSKDDIGDTKLWSQYQQWINDNDLDIVWLVYSVTDFESFTWIVNFYKFIRNQSQQQQQPPNRSFMLVANGLDWHMRKCSSMKQYEDLHGEFNYCRVEVTTIEGVDTAFDLSLSMIIASSFQKKGRTLQMSKAISDKSIRFFCFCSIFLFLNQIWFNAKHFQLEYFVIVILLPKSYHIYKKLFNSITFQKVFKSHDIKASKAQKKNKQNTKKKNIKKKTATIFFKYKKHRKKVKTPFKKKTRKRLFQRSQRDGRGREACVYVCVRHAQ
ncbi:hypothetical protein RFI_27615, partial [Reticulomyxa filosa]